MPITPQEKGDQLERAVRAIEQAILRVSPSYSDKTFQFESKKIITVGGVHHEIDVWVEVDLGKGYRAVFFFECKNWEEKVSKNEIIVFQEKIRSAQAQRGFFVARSFTKDAEAQASSEPRMELLQAKLLPVADVPVPFDFHYLSLELLSVVPKATVNSPEAIPADGRVALDEAAWMLAGEPLNVKDYLVRWANQTAAERSKTFPSGQRPEGVYGVYEVRIQAERSFVPGELTLDGHSISRLEIDVTLNARVIRPPIVSHLQVGGRGRAIELAPAQVGGAEIRAVFTALEQDKPDTGGVNR